MRRFKVHSINADTPDIPATPDMSASQVQLFEDKLPLIRNCPALNDLRLAGELTDLTIEYAYTGQVEITRENALGLAGLAKMVHLPALMNWAVKILAKNVSTEHLEATWYLASCLDSPQLRDACLRRMAAQFENFAYSDLFIRLPADTVLSLLRSDRLAVNSEEEIFGSISRWAAMAYKEAGNANLNCYLPLMLKEVQWDQTTAHFRERLLDYDPLFEKSAQCSQVNIALLVYLCVEIRASQDI
ncbi:unnamed protein product [Dibothriocephalus latus]|uniref:BACK domain-containing protein n=1 Tax=Dibothriocephalus latus TaxID=60516 RepID=A0A3P7L5I2_DIBLA|nr:unnamed protein product [Dibothriocephalus latus]